MDKDRIDKITRALANATDRRAVLKRLAGGALGSLIGVARVGPAGATKKCAPACPKTHVYTKHKQGHWYWKPKPKDRRTKGCPDGQDCKATDDGKYVCVVKDCRKTGCSPKHVCKVVDGSYTCVVEDCRTKGCPDGHDCKSTDDGKYVCVVKDCRNAGCPDYHNC